MFSIYSDYISILSKYRSFRLFGIVTEINIWGRNWNTHGLPLSQFIGWFNNLSLVKTKKKIFNTYAYDRLESKSCDAKLWTLPVTFDTKGTMFLYDLLRFGESVPSIDVCNWYCGITQWSRPVFLNLCETAAR